MQLQLLIGSADGCVIVCPIEPSTVLGGGLRGHKACGLPGGWFQSWIFKHLFTAAGLLT